MTNRLTGLLHIGKIFGNKGKETLVFLRKISPHSYIWFVENENEDEIETDIKGSTIQEAIRLANRNWRDSNFKTLGCGFRYTLPERDEHGLNALFYQMIASYNTMTGVYFDEELGCNCFVQNASIEARNLWKRLIDHAKTL
jgi:hypothetical protein